MGHMQLLSCVATTSSSWKTFLVLDLCVLREIVVLKLFTCCVHVCTLNNNHVLCFLIVHIDCSELLLAHG